jgi:cytochrome c oxidase assembly protein subunit 15
VIEQRDAPRGLHAFAALTALATFVLLLAGATVTSTGSGLSVPDWPLSYGRLLPEMAGGVLFEHSHRLIAGTVALMLIVLAIWMSRSEPRAGVRRLAYAAVALVLAQAVLGGLTVLWLLPPLVSVAHAGLAMIVFGVVSLIALATSGPWRRLVPGSLPAAGTLAPWAAALAGLVFAQILVGAVMRHTGAGLACPDFPLCHGQWIPPLTNHYLAVHFSHRAGGVLVVLAVIAFVLLGRRTAKRDRGLWMLVHFMAVLVVVQFTLGALAIFTRLAVPITVAHHAGGALLFATAVAITAWTRRAAGAARDVAHMPLVEGAWAAERASRSAEAR